MLRRLASAVLAAGAFVLLVAMPTRGGQNVFEARLMMQAQF